MFRPRLMDRLDGVSFSMRYRGTPLRVRIVGDKLTVLAEVEGFRVPVRVGVGDNIVELGAGASHVFHIPPVPAAPAAPDHHELPA
jgi:hypothetical protein